jgi:hypothetical protein
MSADISASQGSPDRRPYESPAITKHQSLKEITLFTNFGPPS